MSLVVAADLRAESPQAATAPAEKPNAEVKTIFAYKQQLGITDSQEKDLKDVLAKFQKDLMEKRQEMQALSTELSDMIKKKEGLKVIRAKIDKVARLQADATYADVETSRKVEGILTPEQISEWKVIQEAFQNEARAKMKEAQEKAKAAEANS